jgi:hypothetical protein
MDTRMRPPFRFLVGGELFCRSSYRSRQTKSRLGITHYFVNRVNTVFAIRASLFALLHGRVSGLSKLREDTMPII